jgi:SAM-dependent methyltransferase
MSPDPRVHPSAATGFERAVDDYERGRPDFPEAAVAFLVDELGLTERRTLLELGAGTGKLTRLLAPSGARIVAVEPLPAMRAALVRRVPDAEVIDAVAEDLPLEDRSIPRSRRTPSIGSTVRARSPSSGGCFGPEPGSRSCGTFGTSRCRGSCSSPS